MFKLSFLIFALDIIKSRGGCGHFSFFTSNTFNQIVVLILGSSSSVCKQQVNYSNLQNMKQRGLEVDILFDYMQPWWERHCVVGGLNKIKTLHTI